jgi:outer membrane lipoprotein-sorting protein
VSDGRQYRVSIPVRNKFAVGDTNAPGKEKNAILNLRPPVILNALFVDIMAYLNSARIRATLEEAREGRRSFYVLSFINVGSDEAQLVEKLWVDRANLKVSRKQTFRDDGKVEMDVEYSYSPLGTPDFPEIVTIQRPVEGYSLKMTFQKTLINVKLAQDAFELQRPAGSELVQLDADQATGAKF